MAPSKVVGAPQKFFRKGSLFTNALHKVPLNESCSFMLSYKYQLFNFLLDLKAAFTRLEHILVHEFRGFLYIGQVSNAFQKR